MAAVLFRLLTMFSRLFLPAISSYYAFALYKPFAIESLESDENDVLER